jgi:hypothetical protein
LTRRRNYAQPKVCRSRDSAVSPCPPPQRRAAESAIGQTRDTGVLVTADHQLATGNQLSLSSINIPSRRLALATCALH